MPAFFARNSNVLAKFDKGLLGCSALGFSYHQTDARRLVVVGATTSTATGKDIALSHATTFTPFVGYLLDCTSRQME